MESLCKIIIELQASSLNANLQLSHIRIQLILCAMISLQTLHVMSGLINTLEIKIAEWEKQKNALLKYVFLIPISNLCHDFIMYLGDKVVDSNYKIVHFMTFFVHLLQMKPIHHHHLLM
jgi:hypothetical protein